MKNGTLLPHTTSNLEKTSSEPTIAMLPWGDVWEDFYGSIGLSFEAFCQEMTGGWLFGYVEALKEAGIRTIIIYPSINVSEPLRSIHKPTGATICLLPVSKSYMAIRQRMIHPFPSLAYGHNLEDLFGDVQGIRRILFKVFRNIAPYLSTPTELLAKELQRECCRAILCQEYEYSRFDTCVLLGHLLRLPVFATFQGGNSDRNYIGRFLRPAAMRTCTGLLCGTQTEIQRIGNQYKIQLDKITKIFNPIDLRTWELIDRHEAREAFGLPQTAKIVVWHGRISISTKGLDILLDAWQHICHERQGQDLRLLLMGAGQDNEELGQRIAALPIQNVLWINQYINDRALMQRFLSTGNVYAFPSRHEGFPVAPIEAMACGLPVVAAAAPGVADIFEEGELSGGLVVPCNDTAAFEQALGRVLDDQTLALELGNRARTRVKACFSLEGVGQQLRKVLLQEIDDDE